MSDLQTRSEEVDLVVLGSGAAGLTCALKAKLEGLETLLIEKTKRYGGTTALSGGVMWVPRSSQAKQEGFHDSTERVLSYLRHHAGEKTEDAKLRRFAEYAPRMLDELCSNGLLDVVLFDGFPDYYAESAGGAENGRSVEPKVFAGSRLGDLFQSLRGGEGLAPAGLVGTMAELHTMTRVRSDPAALLKLWRVFPRTLWNRVARRRYVANGLALVAHLRKGLQDMEVPLWLETDLIGLLEEDGRIVGVRVSRRGEATHVHAARGVVIAAGGFEHNTEMRREFAGSDATSKYTSGAPGNTGDAIRAAIATGAAVDLMDEAWWAPTFMRPDTKPLICIFERGKPGNIIVDAAGRRFANESQPYGDLVKAMQRLDRVGPSTIPAFMIFDSRYRSRYPFAGLLPGVTPRRDIESGFITRAETLDELAKQLEIDAAGLIGSVARFNEMAVRGKDKDFGRGDQAFDRYTGDPTVRPNRCLAPLSTPPYFGVRLYPGDLGTKGGLRTNDHAEVLRSDGTVLRGLYAAGNASASPLGGFYPGAGGTLGPAMTYGYIAALRAAGGID